MASHKLKYIGVIIIMKKYGATISPFPCLFLCLNFHIFVLDIIHFLKNWALQSIYYEAGFNNGF